MSTLAGLGALLLALIAAGAGMQKPEFFGNLPRENMIFYVVAAIAAGLVYALAVAAVRRHPARRLLPLILAVAALIRVVTVITPPLLSTDIFRYVWDGRVQAAGINPYQFLPAAPELQTLRDHAPGWDGIYDHINRVDTAPTIYPPAAQALFALIAAAWSSIWGVKLAMLLFDLLAGAVALLLLRAAREPLPLVLIYAWNPLPAWEFAGAGHIDAAATALSGLALLAAIWRRPLLAGLALGGAVLMKLLPAALFPALWRRWDWRTPLASALVVVAGYAAYSAVGWRVFGYLPGYAYEEGLAGSGVFAIRLLDALGPALHVAIPSWAGAAYAALALAALLLFAAWIALRAPLPLDPAARAPRICRDALILGAALLVALSPHYPWYFAALALPAVLRPARSILWLTIAAPVLYLDDWHDQVIWPALLFLPFMGLLAIDLIRPTLHPAFAAKGS